MWYFFIIENQPKINLSENKAKFAIEFNKKVYWEDFKFFKYEDRYSMFDIKLNNALNNALHMGNIFLKCSYKMKWLSIDEKKAKIKKNGTLKLLIVTVYFKVSKPITNQFYISHENIDPP